MPLFRSRILRFLLAAAVVCAVVAGAGAVAFYHQFLRDLPDLRRIEDYKPPVTSVVLDRKGRPIGEFFVEKRRLVQIDEIPRHVQLAFVAAEDKSFFEHKGLDYSGILRAALANLRAGGAKKQGASTITQQMVKSLLLTPEKTFRRKFREMILARRIEQHFTKDEILYLYVNQIYFGQGAWGIGQAARAYFGKEVKNLNVAESALLAGLPQRPSAYSPYRSPAAAERRRRYVLERMLEDGFIDRAAYDEARDNPPEIRGAAEEEDLAPAAHFTELVRRYLFDRLGGDVVLRQGLVIETTLDLDLQRAAVTALRKGLQDHDRRQGYRGPLRHVAESEIAAEIARVGEQNAELLAGTPEPAPPEPLQEESEDAAPVADLPDEAAEAELGAEAVAAAVTPTELPWGEPLVGVVSEVNDRAGRAHVVFATGVEGEVFIDDVDWAHEVNPRLRPRPVARISKVFRKGDVARFVRIEAPSSPKASADPIPDENALPRLGLSQEPIVQGALLSLDTSSGDVLALVGGYDYERSEFNRATQALRQPGSAFKPFIYGAALEQGYTPVSEVVDRPVVYTDPVSGFVWAPRNYSQNFYGPMPMRNALKKSVNNATVHLFRDVGVDYVIDYARRLGIQSPLSRDLSLALGSSSVTLLELTTSYAVFPNHGRRVVPRFITRVSEGGGGQLLLEDVPLGTPPAPVVRPLVARESMQESGYPDSELAATDQVIPESAAYLMCDLLKAVVQEGTGQRLRELGRPLAGKTGTTNEQGDAWFMGFSPEITTGVWVGHDDNRLLGWGETGARAALPIWGDFMRVALAPIPPRDFEVPKQDIVFERIDRDTGLLADSHTRNAYFQPFIAGTEPKQGVGDRESAADARRALREDIF
jgi:penicillin-binding protein 1A